ncbi:MAG: preprotein translocase subunit SecG [Sphingomicrobium sp.]
MFTFLLIVQTLIAFSLVLVILMQRSEGGGLGVGSSSGGFMTARGAADFLTRSTAVLGGLFVFLSILLAAIAGVTREAPTIDTSLVKQAPASAPANQPPASPLTLPGQRPVPATGQAPKPAPSVPLAQ